MQRELPHLSNSARASNSYAGGSIESGAEALQYLQAQAASFDQVRLPSKAEKWQQQQPPQQQLTQIGVPMRRLVQVYIADGNLNVPIEKALIYSSDQKFTDLTDPELFYELDLKDILTKHNEYRVTVRDKSVKERIELLEPAKVRDLRMTVVVVAAF